MRQVRNIAIVDFVVQRDGYTIVHHFNLYYCLGIFDMLSHQMQTEDPPRNSMDGFGQKKLKMPPTAQVAKIYILLIEPSGFYGRYVQ